MRNAEIRDKLNELAGSMWLDDGELSDSDKAELGAALADFEKNPEAGIIWEEAKARILAELRM